MTVLRRIDRPITFRVAAEEYDLLAAACLNSGARSVSEFARLAVLQRARNMSGGPGGTGVLASDLNTLSMELADLDSLLRGLSGKIRGVLGSSPE